MTRADVPLRWAFHPVVDWPRVAEQWDTVNRAAGRLPFFESAFLTPLLEQFGSGAEMVAFGRRGDTLVASALLVRAGAAQVTTFQPSQLPLGPWLVAQGVDPIDTAQRLVEQLPGLVLGLGLTQLDPLLYIRPAEGPRLDTLDFVPTGWVDVAGTFDAYWERRGKNLRTNMRKQRTKLESEGISLRFETLRSEADVDRVMADYGRLEAAGWKAGMGTSVSPDNAQGRFYASMLRNFCAQGRARIWRLLFDDRVVAMDLCIESDDTMVILKTAFDPEYRTVSPAFLMRQDAFRQVFEEGRLRRIEFYGRLMEWHTRWTENVRMLYHLNLYRWAIVSSVRRNLQRFASRRRPKASPADPAQSSEPSA